MIFFDIQTLTIDNSLFENNGKAGDTTNQGLIVIKLNDGYQISFIDNSFSDISTNNLSII